MSPIPRLFVTILVISTLLLGALTCVVVRRGYVSTKIAQRLVSRCAQGEKDHSPCYEGEVPKLYPQLSVSQVFDVVRTVRRADSSYQFCHVLAHKLGERVVADDASRWVEAIPLNPSDGLCSNGFIHGVIGGRFRTEVLDERTIARLIPDFNRACAPRDGWAPSDLDRAICYHGMGHLFDYITDANLSKALNLCERTTPDTFRRVCIEGVFMQIFQPLEPDDFQLIAQMKTKPTISTVRRFCGTFNNPEYVGACLRESWPFFRESIMEGSGVEPFCLGHPSGELEDHCYQGIFSLIGRLKLGNADTALAACQKAPPSRQLLCYSVIAQSALEEDRANVRGALALCTGAPRSDVKPCIEWLAHQAQFIYGNDTPEYRAFCSTDEIKDLPVCQKSE